MLVILRQAGSTARYSHVDEMCSYIHILKKIVDVRCDGNCEFDIVANHLGLGEYS